MAQAPILAPDDFGITYNGMLITDGAQHYTGALVYISFASVPGNVLKFADPAAYGFVNFIGQARITIVANNQSITTRFAPGQLFVYYDIKNTEVGFGSFAGVSVIRWLSRRPSRSGASTDFSTRPSAPYLTSRERPRMR